MQAPLKVYEYGGVITERNADFATVRIRMPAGVVTPERLRGIADIAERHGAKSIHLTTRQTIELPHMVPDGLNDLVDDLAKNGTPLGAEREEVVNVTACPGTDRCKFANIETIELAKKIDERFFGKDLPLKIRIGISACPNSCVSETLNEIGITGVVKPIRDEGKCTGCGTCVKYCKEGAIMIKSGKIILDPEKCMHCGICLLSCPFNILTSEPPAYRITIGGRRGRHPSLGRHLITVKTEKGAIEVVDKIVYWVYRKSWSGRLLAEQMDEIGYDRFREELIRNLPADEVVQGY